MARPREASKGAGTLILLNTTSFSAAASVSINDVFSSSYTNYQVIFNVASATSQVELFYRMRSSGSDASGSDYYSQLLTANGTSLAGERVSAATSGTLAQIIAQENGIVSYFHRPFESVRTMVTSQSSSSIDTIRFRSVGSVLATFSSYTGFTFYSSQNITGQVSVYGIRK